MAAIRYLTDGMDAESAAHAEIYFAEMLREILRDTDDAVGAALSGVTPTPDLTGVLATGQSPRRLRGAS